MFFRILFHWWTGNEWLVLGFAEPRAKPLRFPILRNCLEYLLGELHSWALYPFLPHLLHFTGNVFPELLWKDLSLPTICLQSFREWRAHSQPQAQAFCAVCLTITEWWALNSTSTRVFIHLYRGTDLALKCLVAFLHSALAFLKAKDSSKMSLAVGSAIVRAIVNLSKNPLKD